MEHCLPQEFSAKAAKGNPMQDLVLLVADKSMKYAVEGILSRPCAIGIRPVSYDLRVHTLCDSGVRTSGVQMLGLAKGAATHALMLLDFEGSGASGTAPELESQLRKKLQEPSNWGDRGDVVVIEPELDVWVWGADNMLRELIEWREQGTIREWLGTKGFKLLENGKPVRPKEALECVLRHSNLPRSSDLYGAIAKRASLLRCKDEAFERFREILRCWFPIMNS